MTLYPLVSTTMGAPSLVYTLRLAQTSWTPPHMPRVKDSCKVTSMAQLDVQCTPGLSVERIPNKQQVVTETYAQQSKHDEAFDNDMAD